MKALDLYRDLLRELDKYESPSFSIRDFNHFIMSTTYEYITHNYNLFEIRQKELDDIGVLVMKETQLTVAAGIATLPDDYLHLTHVRVEGVVILGFDKYITGQTVQLYPKRFRGSRKGFSYRNAYHKPSHLYPFYSVTGNDSLKPEIGDKMTVGKVFIEYIKEPDTIYLNPDVSSDYNQEVNNTTIQFSEYVALEIVKWCRRVFLENIESQRWQSSIQEQQIRQE